MSLELTRREFLTINLGAALAALTAPSVGLGLPGLSPDEGHALLTVTRTLFPSVTGDETGYVRAVLAINERCCREAEAFNSLRTSLVSLDRASGGRFTQASERTRVSALKTLENTSFFHIVYIEALESLYGSPELWMMMRSGAGPSSCVVDRM